MTLGRRSKIRFPLELPVDLAWVDVKGKQCASRGWTKDLSSGGAFITPNPHFHLKQPIQFCVKLPAVDAKSPRGLVCEGRVVRIQSTGPEKGIAVTIESYDLGRKISYQALSGQA